MNDPQDSPEAKYKREVIEALFLEQDPRASQDALLEAIGQLDEIHDRHEYLEPWFVYLVETTSAGTIEREQYREHAYKNVFNLRAGLYDGALALCDLRLKYPEPFQALDHVTPGPKAELFYEVAAAFAAIWPRGKQDRALADTLTAYLTQKGRDLGLRGDELENFLILAQQSGTAQPIDPEVLKAQIAALLEEADPLLSAPDPLEEITKELQRLGWGGDVRPLVVLYLAMTTRLLPKRRGTLLGHTQVNGPPGSGKNYAVDCVLSLFPPEAYVEYDAGSPRVLVYDPVSFKHKVICYSEADSLPGVARGDEDNPAASMMRTLLQKGEARYKVPIKDKETGGWMVQEIVREGPTVLITSTVDRVRGDQLDSRLNALEVPEGRDQQSAALKIQAMIEIQGTAPTAGRPFVAFQAALQLQAPIPVLVPYTMALFELLGQSRGVDNRLLRDAARLLSLVKSVAIVRSRARASDERMVATYDDYQAVADLVVDMYENTVSGASPPVRNLVAVVAKTGRPLSETALAGLLGISQPTTHKHVKTALKNNWLTNLEDRKGHPFRLVPGEPLPHPCGLPSVAQLKAWRPKRTPMSRKGGLPG